MSDNIAQHKIYNIKAGLPFSKILAKYLLQVTADNPEELTNYKILLPTRRACRVLRETFLSINEGKPILLPQLTPLGDVDEEDLSLMVFGNAQGFLDIPEAISPLKRQILLAKLVRSVPSFTQSPEHALALAQGLARFIDQVIVEGLEFSDLHKIVPDEFAAHWQITLDFLKIISENWPKILAEYNLVDASMRRNLLLNALADHWQDFPPDYPVIAAGSTGSIPVAGKLLGVISVMDNGLVILPGLDTQIDDEAWEYIEANHPQHGFKILLDHIGAHRDMVKDFPSDYQVSPRNILALEIMLPAQVTGRWKSFSDRFSTEMLEGLQYYSCSTHQEEAMLISFMLRESLQGKTNIAALVTPDRALARRVSALCKRWGIDVDDSAGQNLLETKLGKFISMSVAAAQNKFDVIALLSLLKISLCRFGNDEVHYNNMLKKLEVKFLRKDYAITSYNMLRNKIEESENNEDLLKFIDGFYAALKPILYYANQSKPQNFTDILKAHIKSIEKLATTPEIDGSDILWRGDTGNSASLFLSDLSAHSDLIGSVTFDEYIKILSSLMRGVTVRSAYGVHPRVLILGQLEARLSDADLVIMGGLNEGIWPPDVGHDPWMSRPMRKSFGLPSSDQVIGIAAHDFVQNFCAGNIVMTRSMKIDGSPTVASRWLDRLDTVLRGCGKNIDNLSNPHYLKWAKMIDIDDDFKPYSRPKPCPPLSTRPDGVSVTKVDLWLKDPYAIYMHYVLKLRKIKPLLQDNDAALRGNILHEILEEFVRKNPVRLPDDAEDQLVEIAQVIINEKLDSPEFMQYWWPRFLKIAAWFVNNEHNWRKNAKFLESEIKGNIDIDIDGVGFNLQGTADRIDRMHGGYAIIDYKTGGNFSQKGLKNGNLPQLPLEALILSQGGFNGRGFKHIKQKNEDKKYVAKGDAVYLGYWKMTGGAEAGKEVAITNNIDEVIQIIFDGLKGLVKEFRNVDTPFYAIPDASNAPRFNDYEHVSRLKEWAALDDAVEDSA